MKISHLISSFPSAIGGMQSYCYNLASQQVKNKHDVHVYISGNADNSLLSDKVKTHRIKPLFTIGKATFPLRLIFDLFRNDYDILHVHLPFHFGFEIALIVSKIKRIPLIITYHCEVVEYNHVTPKAVVFKIYGLINKYLLRFVDYVIFTTEDTANQLKLEQTNSSIIPVGVDIKKFKPRNIDSLRLRYKLKKQDFVILFVGNLDTHNYFKKGVPYILSAIPQLKKKIPNLKMLFIGKTDKNIDKITKKICSTNNISETVAFLGLVNDIDLPNYYSLSNVLILPSVSKLEAFGTVFLEALASGVPIIGSDLPGVKAVIESTSAGFIVRQKSASDVVNKVLEVHAKKSELRTVARKSAVKNYSWTGITKRIESIYKLAN